MRDDSGSVMDERIYLSCRVLLLVRIRRRKVAVHDDLAIQGSCHLFKQ